MNQMSPPEKTAAIRSEARSHLSRLRQERLAKKRAQRLPSQLDPIVPPDVEAPLQAEHADADSETAFADAVDPVAEEELTNGASDVAGDEAEDGVEPLEETADSADAEAIDDCGQAEEGSGEAGVSAATEEDAPDLGEDGASVDAEVDAGDPGEDPVIEDIAPEADPPDAHVEASSDTPGDEEATLPEADTTAESDLEKLPGSGPGLVWMLQKCGVHSMDELAEVDAEKLKADMGLVAKVLDLEFWIEFARENRA